MKKELTTSQIVTKLMFRLLPVQILLAAVNVVNGIVSSLFASNFIGTDALGAVGLYSPINMLIGAVSTMLVGGSQILCGKYLGKNQIEKMRNVFSLDMVITVLIAVVFSLVMVLISIFDWSGFLTTDPVVRPIFNRYLLGQAVGVLPMMLSAQLSAFLSLENNTRRTTVGSIIFIVVNVLLNALFVIVLDMGVLGLALASALGLWVFFAVQAQYFISGKSTLRLSLRNLFWGDSREIVTIGVPGAISYGYQAVRGIIVNLLLVQYIGTAGLSAFTAANSLLTIFWAVPTGMLAVSRMMISISVGEEDRRTLTDVMRTAMYRYLPLMCAVSALIIALAVPFTRLYYRDVTEPVYQMTVSGFRILPLCMPLSLIYMHFACYGQASNKQLLVHILGALDGVICVAGFTALLIPLIGMNSVYIANVLNGVVTTLVIIGYAWIKGRKFPRNMEELMVIPEEFGVPEQERMDLSLMSMDEVVNISEGIQNFCLEKGIDSRRSHLAGLFMEEMAGNVILHGFSKDKKKHTVDIRVVHKNEDLILRIKDDCVPFDPAERLKMVDPDDITKNIGIRMVYSMTENIDYQNILGLNVLTLRI